MPTRNLAADQIVNSSALLLQVLALSHAKVAYLERYRSD